MATLGPLEHIIAIECIAAGDAWLFVEAELQCLCFAAGGGPNVYAGISNLVVFMPATSAVTWISGDYMMHCGKKWTSISTNSGSAGFDIASNCAPDGQVNMPEPWYSVRSTTHDDLGLSCAGGPTTGCTNEITYHRADGTVIATWDLGTPCWTANFNCPPSGGGLTQYRQHWTSFIPV